MGKTLHQWFLPACICAFAGMSCIVLASIRPDLAVRQFFFFILGLLLFFAASRLPFQMWLQYRWLLYAGMLLLLALPLFLGHSSRNTSRWIELRFMRLQPSQLAIPLGVLGYSWVLARRRSDGARLLLGFSALLPPAALIFISPDLGTTAVFLAVTGSLLWFAGISLRWLTALAVAAAVTAVFSWNVVLRPYQRERMASFLAGAQQSDEQHYNATQALIAIGSGGFFGKGWGRGTQSHLDFLPEDHTDFFYSSFAEESGFLGSVLLLCLTGALCGYLLAVARPVTDQPAGLYLITAAVTFFLQSVINIGMNAGLLPITGVTLPLLSYGGSSILASSLLLGIAASAAASIRTAQFHKQVDRV